MSKFKLFLALAFVSVALISCDPSDSNGSAQNDDTFVQNFGNSVSKDFIGQVVDVNNHPIQNAEIKIGTSTVQTDINGVFIINGAAVHEKFAYITATKAGYIDGSRAMVPTSGKNNVKIMMIPNTPLQTIQSGVDSEVALPSGTKVAFDGEFQDENGNSYTGTVSVSMFHLLSSDENIDKLMPGMLYAQTKTNQEAVLETFGMLNVELRGSAGQKLNIKEGHTAEITLKIDNSQTATAPNSIPLWHFDEEKGYWKEDGVATKVGNKYVGEVSHFSWWNCDIPNASILLTFNFVDSQGNPLPNLTVIIFDSNNFHATGITDSNGQLLGMFPANQTFIINLNSPFYNCSVGDVISITVGPFTSDTILPSIIVPNNLAMRSTKVSGELLKCDGNKVVNGYVFLIDDNHTEFVVVSNGSFSFNVLYCSDDSNFKLQGIDFDNNQLTGEIDYNYRETNTTIGSIFSCNASEEFATYKVDNGETQVFSSIFSYTVNYNSPFPDYFLISGHNILGAEFAISAMHHLGVSGSNSAINLYSSLMFAGYSNIANISNNNLTIEVNKIGAIGEFSDLVFYGNFTNPTGFHTISGTAHVRRDN